MNKIKKSEIYHFKHLYKKKQYIFIAGKIKKDTDQHESHFYQARMQIILTPMVLNQNHGRQFDQK